MVNSIQDKYYSAMALQPFLIHLEKRAIPFSQWCDVMDKLAYRNRSDLFNAIPDSRLTIIRLGSEESLSAVLQGVREVCQQWP